jgi:hypothetical protein
MRIVEAFAAAIVRVADRRGENEGATDDQSNDDRESKHAHRATVCIPGELMSMFQGASM